MEGAACAFADHRRLRHRDGGDDPRHVRYQAFWQVAHLRAGVGDDLLALAVVEFLGDLKRPSG